MLARLHWYDTHTCLYKRSAGSGGLSFQAADIFLRPRTLIFCGCPYYVYTVCVPSMGIFTISKIWY